jgi:tetratricopeptide (TPR) repeat protein
VREANIGDSAGALVSYGKALSIREKLATHAPVDAEARRELVPNYGKLSDLLMSTGDAKGSMEYSRRLLALSEQLAALPGAAMADRLRLATSYLDYGYKLGLIGGDRTAGLESCRRALAAFTQLASEAPDDRRLQRVYSIALDRTAELLEKEKASVDEALSIRRNALAMKRKLQESDPLNTDYRRLVAWGMYDLAFLQRKAGEHKEAVDGFRAALELFRRLAAEDPASAQFQKDVAAAERQLQAASGHSH